MFVRRRRWNSLKLLLWFLFQHPRLFSTGTLQVKFFHLRTQDCSHEPFVIYPESMLRSSLFMLLVLANNAVGSIRLPLPLEAADCSVAAPFNELPNAQFERKGGRRTASKVLFQRGVLTVNDV